MVADLALMSVDLLAGKTVDPLAAALAGDSAALSVAALAEL